MIGAAIFSLTALGAALGMLLGLAGKLFRVESDPLLDEVEQLFPGSQCGQCGFPGCRPAAEAVVSSRAPVTLCPPGGRALAEKLASKLNIAVNLANLQDAPRQLARVREETCIGCTRCFKVCPTDAIVGAPKQIHFVISEACTGCGNCLDVCPTECLALTAPRLHLKDWRWHKPRLEPVCT